MKFYREVLKVAAVASALLPAAGMASTSAVIDISATVTKACVISVKDAGIAFDSATGLGLDTVPRKSTVVTTKCGGSGGKVTLSTDKAAGNKLNLFLDGNKDANAATLPVEVTVDGQDADFQQNKMVVDVPKASKDQTLTFKLAGDENTDAGSYKGTLNLAVAVD